MIETLIVDDEVHVGLTLKHILEKSDYRCTTALNTAEARARLEERSFELVLLDIIMPGESGMDLLQHLQAAHPDTAVVLISVIDDPRVAAKALDLGAFGYLPKPFDANEVLINLADAVRRRDLEIENRAQRQKLAELVRERTVALIASETRYQTLLGALPDPVIAYDPEGRATYVNEAFEKTFGWSGEEVLGQRIDFVPSDPRQGEDIPLGARILKVALDFDALQAWGQTPVLCLDKMRQRRGWYDPVVLEAFAQVVAQESGGRIVSLDVADLKPRMIMAEDVRNALERVVVQKGTELTGPLVTHLMASAETGAVAGPVKVVVPS